MDPPSLIVGSSSSASLHFEACHSSLYYLTILLCCLRDDARAAPSCCSSRSRRTCLARRSSERTRCSSPARFVDMGVGWTIPAPSSRIVGCGCRTRRARHASNARATAANRQRTIARVTMLWRSLSRRVSSFHLSKAAAQRELRRRAAISSRSRRFRAWRAASTQPHQARQAMARLR